jgi:hypothetical protein
MTAPVWRVEFHRAAVRDLRKLDADGQRRVLRYLRERIAGSEDPRRNRSRHRGRPFCGAGGDGRPPADGLSLRPPRGHCAGAAKR